MQAKSTKYFASRNGFDGFTSYFNHVFSPEKFNKIFILKGGPGTGKSTLMKKLEVAFSDESEEIDCILCSSDKESYDGLIIKKNGRKIAFLDGTSPHLTDPTLPVVCEEIINLERAIEEDKIITHRTQLENLYRKKKNEYQLAYHFLLVCGEIDRNYSAVSYILDNNKEKNNLLYILEKLPYLPRDGIQKLLYTSFGKDGFFEIDHSKKQHFDTLYFNKNSRVSQLLCDNIKNEKISSNIILNCFTGDVDRIEIPFLDLTLSFSEEREIETSLLSIYKEALEIAKSHFASAAKSHFEMEKYYIDALNFNVLNDIFESLREKTKVLLSIS